MANAEQMVNAVHAYVAAFDREAVDAIGALYADEATVEDPVGNGSLVRGRVAILAFYAAAMKMRPKLQLQGPIRICANYAVFAFTATIGDGERYIEVIDTFRFDDSGKIVEMRAFWGPSNMHGF
ncbi:MAG: nuclear transport factor 2 family protein [Pseudomonadota bacterium]|jgi:steroid delta-isomerase